MVITIILDFSPLNFSSAFLTMSVAESDCADPIVLAVRKIPATNIDLIIDFI
jgi:hypothetical protein